MLTVVRVSCDLQVIRPVEHTNLKVRTTLVRYPFNAIWYDNSKQSSTESNDIEVT